MKYMLTRCLAIGFAITKIEFLFTLSADAVARERSVNSRQICVLERQPPHRTAIVPTSQHYIGPGWKSLTGLDVSPLLLENLFSEQIADYETSPPYRVGILCLVYVGREVTAYFGDNSGQCARAFSSSPTSCNPR